MAVTLDFTKTQEPSPPPVTPPTGAIVKVPDSVGIWHWSNGVSDMGLAGPKPPGLAPTRVLDFTKALPVSPPSLQPIPPGANMKVMGSDGLLHWSDGSVDLGVVR